MTTTTGWVTIDSGPRYFRAQYDPTVRWNGWLAAPEFDALTVMAIFDMANADGPDYGYTIDWDDDGALVIVDHQWRDEDPDYTPERIEPNDDGLYTPGAFGWVWIEAHPLEAFDVALDALGVDAGPHGLAILARDDGRTVLLDEPEQGTIRVGVYADALTDTALDMHETDDADEAVAFALEAAR